MFPENLRYLREKHSMEQIDLAHKLGRKSSSSVSEWEKGKYTPKVGVLNDIAELFSVSMSDLMNTDLSKKTNSVEERIDFHKNITTIYKQLEEPRQKVVYETAEQQLEEQHKEQNNVVNLKDAKKNSVEGTKTDDLAAHSDDPNRTYTKEEIEFIKKNLERIAKENNIDFDN